jgi:hypothetical protein
MFRKYQHIERLDSDEVEGLLDGEVFIMPKIDGNNVSIWFENGRICVGNRHREFISTEAEDDRDFFYYILQPEVNQKLETLFREYPDWRLYGEWLVPHNLRTYEHTAWEKFYIFDVERDGVYLPYKEYQPVLEARGLDYIPVITTITNPTSEELLDLLKENTYLIQAGRGFGEGLIVKRYDFINKYGRTTWGKVVADCFKESNAKEMNAGYEVSVERAFAEQYVTTMRINKMLIEMGDWNPKRSVELFNRIYHDLVNEELWNFLKKKKFRVALDFSVLYDETVSQMKILKPELF